jgi:hypothetical protein
MAIAWAIHCRASLAGTMPYGIESLHGLSFVATCWTDSMLGACRIARASPPYPRFLSG